MSIKYKVTARYLTFEVSISKETLREAAEQATKWFDNSTITIESYNSSITIESDNEPETISDS